MKRFLKVHRWWDYQLTIMLGFVYHITAMASAMPNSVNWLMTFVPFVIACLGIAGLGHLVNDYFDRETDQESGAPNLLADQSVGSLVAKAIVIVLLGCLPWLWLPTDSVILSLLVLELVLFIMYSVPRIRLKERGMLGPVADSLYSYTISTCVATLVFAKLADYSISIWISSLIATWSFLLGLRRILEHQIQDASRDERTGLRTFVTIHGLRRVFFLLEWCIFPCESSLFVIVLCILSSHSAITCVGFLLYLAVVILVDRHRSIWHVANPWKLPRVSRLMFLNDTLLFRFYTEWFPILGLIPLLWRDFSYMIVAVLHILLFKNGPKTTIRWIYDTVRCKVLAW